MVRRSLLWLVLLSTSALLGDEPVAKPEVLVNSLGMKLVRIASGEFTMGSPESEAGRTEVEQQHRVCITQPFYLGQHEVTRGEFQRFVDATGYKTSLETEGKPGFGFNAATNSIEILSKFNWRETGFEVTEKHPVTNVSWRDAAAFCEWLSKTEDQTYRLPTEAQWEYACRAGTTTRYFTGDTEDSLRTAANMADAAFLAKYTNASWSGDWNDGHAFTAPVGSFVPNRWGLHDMAGNVWEWCSDWYAADYFARSPVNDPAGPEMGQVHVLRGGSFTNRDKYVRSADRDGDRPKYRYNFTGFRVLRVIP